MADSQSTVIYRDIPTLPGYRVGDDGSVWSNRPHHVTRGEWRQLRVYRNRKGYVCVSLAPRDVRVRGYAVHRLVLEAFIGPRPQGMEACHADGNRTNNTLGNLRWDTPTANAADSLRHGTRVVGSKSVWAKVTEEKVRAIREQKSAGASLNELCRRFGLRKSTVSYIVNHKTWKHVV